jgi:hypothetical protein
MILKTEVAQSIQSDPSLVYLNDHKFMLELSRQCDFYFIDESLVQYRIHAENSISKNRDIWERDAYCLSRYLMKKYECELSRKILSKHYARMGVHLYNQRHPRYARKCFGIAIKNNSRKTSYYKKFIKAAVRSLLN